MTDDDIMFKDDVLKRRAKRKKQRRQDAMVVLNAIDSIFFCATIQANWKRSVCDESLLKAFFE